MTTDPLCFCFFYKYMVQIFFSPFLHVKGILYDNCFHVKDLKEPASISRHVVLLYSGPKPVWTLPDIFGTTVGLALHIVLTSSVLFYDIGKYMTKYINAQILFCKTFV